MEPKGEIFFGEVLRAFRKRKRLSQHQLAQQIGVNRDSVSSWERGEYHPATPTLLHELVRVLDLSANERTLLFESLYGTASILPLYNLPEHTPYFTGREEILGSLHAQLTAGKQVALTQIQAISGLGGIGKTRVAIEYAYRFRDYYHDILWVSADSRESLVTSYLTLARLLGLREREEREQHKVVEAVKRWLREHKGWLLILDNLEELELMREFVPTPRQGAVVLTTRRAETRPIAQPIPLDVMPQEIGALFLLRRVGLVAPDALLEAGTPADVTTAHEITAELGGLPLALDQAGSYIEETQCGLASYLQRYRTQRVVLLKRRGRTIADHPEPCATTWSLSFERLEQQNPAAADLLRLCAFLHPDAIPEEILIRGAIHLGPRLSPAASDPLLLDEAIAALRAYSLIHRETRTQTLSIHRLVQAMLQDRLSEVERHLWAERALLAVNAAFPHVEDNAWPWPQCERLLPQALTGAQIIEQYQVSSEEAGRLLYETASYLREHARYSEAEPLYQRALQIREQQTGPEHSAVATSLQGLATLYHQQAKYAEAEPLYQRALRIWEQQSGPNPSQMARSLNSLAELYRGQGKYAEAEPLYQRALRILEQHLGSDHPQADYPLNNLAILYMEQGKYAEAEPLYQRALRIQEQQLGPDHPLVARSLNNLANLYKDQGKYTQAEPLYQRALHIWEQQSGSDHPQVAYPLNNLAILYMEQGKYAEAEPLYQRALRIWEQQLGPDHPQVAYPLNNLAELYFHEGKYAEAESLYQRALRIWEQQLGPKHYLVAHSLNGLAGLYREQGKYREAELLYQRALYIREQQWGSEHPDTAETMHDFARLREAQGNAEEARTWYAQALAIREQVLGACHPKTTETRKRLIALLHTMG